MSNQLAEALRRLIDASMVAMTDQELATGETLSAWEDANEALAAHEAAKERTGWPADGRMAQDDSRELSKWLSNTPGARRLVDEAAKPAEPVYYEFRPVSGDGEWRRVEPRDRVYGVGEALADIRAYRYEGKPCYEIRALYAAPVAVASPLTVDQVKKLMTDCGYDQASRQESSDFINGIRHAELAHGIKEKDRSEQMAWLLEQMDELMDAKEQQHE